MKCPHCATTVFIPWKERDTYKSRHSDPNLSGVLVTDGACPKCKKPIVALHFGPLKSTDSDYPELKYWITSRMARRVNKMEIIYPSFAFRPLPPEVPEVYRNEFNEAQAISGLSPNASAALSRRLLQRILRDEFGLKAYSLAQEISQFLTLDSVPGHLREAIDAVRKVGNLAAHPTKDRNTGEIVDVEPGEAEWLLDILEWLFDFKFVQPKINERRKKALNEKLAQIGKPLMRPSQKREITS